MSATLEHNLNLLPADVRDELLKHGEIIAQNMELLVKARIAKGEGQPPYATRPGWFSMTKPRGRKKVFEEYIQQFQGKSGRASKRRKTIFMPGGYAEWRSLWRGEAFHTKPVVFQLTGQLIQNLKGQSRKRPAQGEVVTWLSFRRQKRSYGRLTNEMLMDILNKRGAFPPFAISSEDADKIISYAVDEILRKTGAK